MTKNFNLNDLARIMQCTYCNNKNENNLKLIDHSLDLELTIKQHKKSIKCKICNEIFPITEDKIPYQLCGQMD